MTNLEAENLFDTLYNNIQSNQAPGIDSYEKSLFLTKAQDELVKAYFNSTYNKANQGFDEGAKRQIDFANLIDVVTSSAISNPTQTQMDPRSTVYPFPSKAIAIIQETLELRKNTTTSMQLQVIPIQYSEYVRLMSKPFKWPLKGQAWRLINNSSTTQSGIATPVAELIARKIYPTGDAATLGSYTVRFIRKPLPIILTPLTDTQEGLTIEGRSQASAYGFDGHQMSELNPEIHEEIVQRAVELAKISFQGGVSEILQGGNISSTEKGLVAKQS